MLHWNLYIASIQQETYERHPSNILHQTVYVSRIDLLWFKLNDTLCKHTCALWYMGLAVGLLICTLISENQGLDKLRSVSNLRNISRSYTPGFFFSLSHGFFSDLWYKSRFFFRWRPRKKIRFAGPEIFLRFEADLGF